MKYCVSGRQQTSAIINADEIKVKFQDIDGIANFIVNYPDKTCIYEIPAGKTEDEIQWNKLQAYAKDGNLKLALNNLKLVNICNEKGLK